VNRTAEWHHRRSKVCDEPASFAEPVELHLTPLPCWEHFAPETRRVRLDSMLNEIIVETRERNLAAGRVPPGPAFILAQDPHARPFRSSKSPSPDCHSSMRALRQEFREAYRSFLDAYLEASDRLRRGYRDVQFPVSCFPPPRPYIGSLLDPAPT
jgi:hypothetical protein